jgi:outer membrane protein assembly factor BamB
VILRPVKRPCILAAVCAIALGSVADASAAPRIGAYPKLVPAFDAKTTDYVSRCHRGRPLLLAVHAGAGTAIRIGNAKPAKGSAKARLNRDGGQGTTVRIGKQSYHVRCLNKTFPAFTSERTGTPQARFYVVTPAEGGEGSQFVTIFDSHSGAPIWWMQLQYKPIDAKLLPDGNLAWSTFTDSPYATRSVPYEERRLDGTKVRSIAAVGVETDSHDLQVLPNGDYLLLSYVPRDGEDLSPYGGPANATVTDAVVQEVSPQGKLVWSWSSNDHVATSEFTPFMGAILQQPAHLADGRTAYDIAHVNSVEADGDSVLISLRHADAVYKVSRTTGAIQWKLGGKHTPESLAVEGDTGGSDLVFSGQHDARLQPDGTITMHDNRTGSKVGPRAVRYRVDEQARTATQVEQVTDEEAALSLCCGSARRLPGGNWVMSWGYNGLVTELTPSGERVFGLRFPGGLFSYRAVPITAGELSAAKLRAGMDAMHSG